MTRDWWGVRISPGAFAAQKRASTKQPVWPARCYCLIDGKTGPAEIHVDTTFRSRARRVCKGGHRKYVSAVARPGPPGATHQAGAGKHTAGRHAECAMTAMSLVWIAPAIRGGGVKLRALRAAGFLPVAVESPDGALSRLRQFRAGAVVLHVGEGRGWEDCARLLATCSPVAVLMDAIHPDVTHRYLSAGCAAVLETHCPPDQLAAALMRVATRDVQVSVRNHFA